VRRKRKICDDRRGVETRHLRMHPSAIAPR
jgi:hypothetical protein